MMVDLPHITLSLFLEQLPGACCFKWKYVYIHPLIKLI